MEKFTVVKGVAAPFMIANVTTDSMSPTSAGKSTSVDLGVMLFAILRYDDDGKENPDFILNRPPFRKSAVLVAGPNFGCGSSRERAVWALMRFGIRCVIAPSFADIFYDNALQNGLLPVKLSEADCTALATDLGQCDDPTVTVDLDQCVVTGPDGKGIPFSVAAEHRTALMEGLDEISVILRMEPDIDTFQQSDRQRRPWIYLDR